MEPSLKTGLYLNNGKYLIERVLGQGSFGITYLAKTTIISHGRLGSMEVEARVAIKEFFMSDVNSRRGDGCTVEGSSGSIFTNYRKKFKAEAENLSKLSHPNIVKVSDVFDENNTTYYVMEFVEGTNLDDYINQRGALPESEAISIMNEIGGALEYMHNRKMLHLDIKPKNIMRKSDGRYYLIDFGLSKQFTQNGEPESSTTIGLGTPGYAPIEQAVYVQDGTFPATLDIYALGATMFKMLVGQRPPEATMILNEGFPENELLQRGVSPRIVGAIKNAMACIRKDRTPSVNAFLNSINDVATEDKTIINPKVNTGHESIDDQDNTIVDSDRTLRSKEVIVTKPRVTLTTGEHKEKNNTKLWYGLFAVILMALIAVIYGINNYHNYAVDEGSIDSVTVLEETSYDSIFTEPVVEQDEVIDSVEAVQDVLTEDVSPIVEETYSKSAFKSEFHTSGCDVYNIAVGGVGAKLYYYADGPEDAYAVILLNGHTFKFRGGQDEGLAGLDRIGGSGSLYLDWNLGDGDMTIEAMEYPIRLR